MGNLIEVPLLGMPAVAPCDAVFVHEYEHRFAEHEHEHGGTQSGLKQSLRQFLQPLPQSTQHTGFGLIDRSQLHLQLLGDVAGRA